MSSTLLFLMVAVLFVHTMFNSLLKIYACVVAKVSGNTTVSAVEHSVEMFFVNIFAGIFNWFKSL